jgi:hypothetical protein
MESPLLDSNYQILTRNQDVHMVHCAIISSDYEHDKHVFYWKLPKSIGDTTKSAMLVLHVVDVKIKRHFCAQHT